MNNYIIRVELHHATADRYERLHALMASAGFPQVIRGDSGYVFELPPAEYTGTTVLTVTQVRDLVASVAKAIVPSVAIMVVEYTSAAWLLPLAA